MTCLRLYIIFKCTETVFTKKECRSNIYLYNITIKLIKRCTTENKL